MSILDTEFPPGSFAVLDIETTGLTPAIDRIVEIAIYHVDGPGSSTCVLNTLINPQRKVSGTEIHGITDEDVRDAPTFADAAPTIAAALSGRVLVAHNVYFDLRFLTSEFERCGLQTNLPHLCTMYLPPMLGTGERRTLDLACAQYGIPRHHTHCADDDASAAAQLLRQLLAKSSELGVRTFRDLSKRKKYKFVESFKHPTPNFSHPSTPLASKARRLQGHDSIPTPSPRPSLRSYFEALVAAVTDLELTHAEVAELKTISETAGLSPSQIRAAHGKLYAAFLNRYLDDSELDDQERWVLSRVWEILGQLGWAPGQ